MNATRACARSSAHPRRALLIALLALAPLALLPAPGRPAAPPAPQTLDADQLQPGMKAVVRTVFQGERVETFDAEIVGVLYGGSAEGDQIIARATSEKAIRSGIAQGMSGSPVYVDGRLIGALSGGWSFVREPLFVITPVKEMLETLDHPVTSDPYGTGGPSGIERTTRSAPPRFGAFRWSDDDGADVPAVPAPRPLSAPGPTALPLPLAASGLAAGALDEARALFEPLGLTVTPGGRTGIAKPAPSADSLVPGSSVAIDLLRGDLRLSAIGTMTWREGDRVLLFGHPFFQAGEVRLPLSTASIVTIVSNEVSSFKLGATGTPVGTVTQDRRAAVAGRIGAVPRLLPLTVRIAHPGMRAQQFHFESVEDRNLFPQLVSVATLNAALEAGGTSGQNTLRWRMRLVRHDGARLDMTDVIASDAPLTELPSAIGAPIKFLAGNPYRRLELDSVSVDVTSTPGRDQWTVRNARLASASVRAGGTARVRVELEHWHGGTREVTVDVPVPEELPDGRYILWVGGASELTRMEAQRLPGRYRPTSLEDAWNRFGALRTSDQLYASIVAMAPEVTRDGRDYPELPASAYALLAGAQLAGDDARHGERVFLSEMHVPESGAVRGEQQLALVVDSRSP